MDAPEELPQHSVQRPMATPHIRRASEIDADVVAQFVPGLVPSATEDHRATFIYEAADGPIGVMELLQEPQLLVLEHLVVSREEAALALMAFADSAARALGAPEIRLSPGAVSDTVAIQAGFREGRRKVPQSHLEMVGVPLWRDGAASFSTSLYYRGVWASLALLIGLGSISAAVFSGGKLTLAHIVLPGILCVAGTLFALWQIFLMLRAARRSGRRALFATAATLAVIVVGSIGATVADRAVPSLAELWNIYTGDTELGDLDVRVGPGGKTLYVEGAYGLRSEDAVRRALDEHRTITTVVLAGPGGRIGTGYALFRMFRERKLATRVDTGCASACTIAFLGGVERSIAANGKLGFHRASFPGMGDDDMYESNRDMRQFLIYNARVTPQFAQRVVDTPAETLWVPTPEELLAGKVVTRVNR